MCEQKLIKICKIDNFLEICSVADLYNANRLKEFCAWFQRINPKVNDLLYVNGGNEKDSNENVIEIDQQSMYSFLEYKFSKDDEAAPLNASKDK